MGNRIRIWLVTLPIAIMGWSALKAFPAKIQNRNLDVGGRIGHVVTIGSDKLESDDFFATITDLHIDESNEIHVMDGQERRLARFDLKGNLKGKFLLPQGEGPGEYSRPKCFTFDGSRYAIGDMNLKRITVLDQSGKYLSSFRVEEQPGHIQIYENRLFLSGLFDYSKNRVHIYDLGTQKKIASICPGNAMTKETAAFGEADSFKIADERIYFSCFFPYEISIYSLDGKLRHRFTPINSEFGKELQRDKLTKALRFVIGTLTILPYKKHIINVLRGRNIEKRLQYSVFDIFKESGESVISFPATELSEDFVRNADVNDDGYLVVSSIEPFPRVRVFLINHLF